MLNGYPDGQVGLLGLGVYARSVGGIRWTVQTAPHDGFELVRWGVEAMPVFKAYSSSSP